MKIHNLIQGSPEWLAYRATMRNASDAPAMMGCSIYKTRAELLREAHTGLVAEVDIGTQKRFDNGHRAEALARPLAEEFIGAELYPVTGSLGNLSASFDGLTLDECTAYEHKALNADLRAAFAAMVGIDWNSDAGPGLTLPMMYRVQMEQQLLVSGAERVLFMTSAWTPDDELIEEQHCWYYPDATLRQQIVDGWQQFERDLGTYAPPPIAEPARAKPMDSLPAVSVRLDGALSVAGNLPSFAVALREFIGRMPERPTTDNDFATVDAACKALKKAEEALDAAEAGALASITDVEAMRRAVADCRKLARDTRLASEKLVERRKVEIKEQAVAAARRALDDHIAALNAELAPMRLQPMLADFPGCIKGLRSFASMQDALDTTLAAGKIAADAQARLMRANLAHFKKTTENMEFLFADLGALVHKPPDDFEAVLAGRIRKQLDLVEAQEKKRQADEQQRQQAEAERQAAAALAAAAAPPPAPPLAQDECRPLSVALATKPDAPLHAREAAAAIAEPATLNLGAINARFGGRIKLDAAGLALMGIEHSATDKSARLYRESDIGRICRALVVMCAEVQELQAA